jgi:hypothetical protein
VKKTWADDLKRWRIDSNLIQKEAASNLGVSFHTYRGWEYGKHNPPEYVKTILFEKIYGNRIKT